MVCVVSVDRKLDSGGRNVIFVPFNPSTKIPDLRFRERRQRQNVPR